MAAVAIWGRSLAIRFPKSVVAKLNIQAGDEIEFPEQDGIITIKKKTRQRPTLDELLATVPDHYQPEEGWNGLKRPMGSEV